MRTWLLRFARLARGLGSLHVAVLVLPLLALVLALGALVESWYDNHVARLLVYETWWFVALLVLLGVNVLCAALKKRPWKKHQTGFLITHLGLITLVIGGMFTALGGVQGTMVLVNSDDPAAAVLGRPAADAIVDTQREVIVLRRPNRDEGHAFPFHPGPFAWQGEPRTDADVGPLCRTLAWLAQPFPRRHAWELGGNARLDVLEYHPHARQQPYRPVSGPVTNGFPALEVELASPATGVRPPLWLALHDADRAVSLGPGVVEIIGRRCRPEQIDEFGRPPEAPGRKGTLVVGLNAETWRLDVERHLGGDAVTLGASNVRIGVTQYLPNYKQPKSDVASDPGLVIEIAHAGGKASFAAVARQAGEIFPLKQEESIAPPSGLWTWYHPPDYRHGAPGIKAVLQFVTDASGRLHFRSFASAKKGAFHFEKPGTCQKGGPRQSVWAGMGWKFRVVEFFPEAVIGPVFLPVDRPPGQEDADTVAALKCRITRGAASEIFWLGRTHEGGMPVHVGGEPFWIGYNPVHHDLGFSLRLVKAEQTTEVGSKLPATQTSYVELSDGDARLDGEARTITLNEPLEHRGFRIYQAGFQHLGQDSRGKPVVRSVFRGRYDPGLWLKYAGSTMVALGIGCMFYMRAYFFKRPEGSQPA